MSTKNKEEELAIQIIRDDFDNPIAFQVQIRLAHEQPVFGTFKSYEKAEEFERNTMRLIRAARSATENRRGHGRRMKPAGVAALAAMRVAQLAIEFAEAESEHAFARYAKKLGELVGEARVCDLDKAWTKRFCQAMRKRAPHNKSEGYAEGTIGKYIAMIRRLVNWKAESLGIDAPRLGLTTKFLEPGWDQGRDRRLKPGEEPRIRAELGMVGAKTLWKKGCAPGQRGKPWACARHYQLIFDFAIETCAREAEMVELPWKELDLERRLWTLPAKRSKKRLRRKIYLTPRAMAIVDELAKDRAPGSDRVFHRLPSVEGFRNTFHAVIERLGIEDFVFHDLRHEGNTRHRLAKHFEPGVLMRMVGHSSKKMSELYFNPEDEEVLGQMDAAMLANRNRASHGAHAPSPADSMLAQCFGAFLASQTAMQSSATGAPQQESASLVEQFQALMAKMREGAPAS